VTSSWTRFRFIIGALVIVWALNSLATFFIIPSVPQHLYAVKILGQQGKIEEAATEAAKAVEADPSNAAAHGYRALSLSELGDNAEAVKEGERAIELAPMDSGAHVNLAIATKRADMERAMAEARRAIELGPENFSASQLLMKFLLESGRFNEAAALGPEWLAVSPFDVVAHSSVAVAMAQTGDLATAARHLGYVMMLRPNAEEAFGQVHQILRQMRRIHRECWTNSRGCSRRIPTRMRAMAPSQFASPRALASSQTGACLLYSLHWLRLMLRLEIFYVASLPAKKL